MYDYNNKSKKKKGSHRNSSSLESELTFSCNLTWGQYPVFPLSELPPSFHFPSSLSWHQLTIFDGCNCWWPRLSLFTDTGGKVDVASGGKESACNAGDPGLISWKKAWQPNPLHCSCLEHSMDRGAWWATVHGVAKSQTQLSDITSSSEERVKVY